MQGQSGFFIQFIRLTGPFWNSENKAIIRKRTSALIVLTVLQLIHCSHHDGMERSTFQCALNSAPCPDYSNRSDLLVLILAVNMAVTATAFKSQAAFAN